MPLPQTIDAVIKSSMTFYRKSGLECTAKQWADNATADAEIVGHDIVSVNGEDVFIFSRYSGLDHETGKVSMAIARTHSMRITTGIMSCS